MSLSDLIAEIRATPFFWRVRLQRRLHRHAAMEKRIRYLERRVEALVGFIELEAEEIKRKEAAEPAYVAAAAVAARRREIHLVPAKEA